MLKAPLFYDQRKDEKPKGLVHETARAALAALKFGG